MHGQFLQIWGSKVSKSKWDDLSVASIIAKWYDPLDLRYFYLTGHYRSFLDFTREALDAAKSSREGLIKKIASHLEVQDFKDFDIYEWRDLYWKLITKLSDDLDIVWTFSVIYSELKDCESAVDILILDQKITKLWLREWVEALLNKSQEQAPEQIILLAQQRLEAKTAKDRTLADLLRDQITDAWWEIKDVNTGYELIKL